MFNYNSNFEQDIILLFRIAVLALKKFKSCSLKQKCLVLSFVLIIAAVVASCIYGLVYAYGQVWREYNAKRSVVQSQATEKPFEVIDESYLDGDKIMTIRYKESGCKYIITNSKVPTPYLNKDGKPDCT